MPSPATTESLEPTKAQRVFLLLRDAITNGDFAPGSYLPGEPKLGDIYGVSRVTVRKALAELDRAGLIERRPGAGTMVKPRQVPSGEMVADFANVLGALVEMGRNTGVRLLQFGFGMPPADVQRALRLPDGERTQRSIRVRLIDGEPFSYLLTHVPEAIGVTYSESDLASTPLLTLLERSGVKADHATQTVGAALATPTTADALSISVGSPLLTLTRTVFDPDGYGIEHLTAFYRPDRYRLQMTLARRGGEEDRHWAPTLATPQPLGSD